MDLKYLDYERSRRVPNIVVDGSANASTVVTLSHWPGANAPDGLARDLSAEMAFAYLDNPSAHEDAGVVTNNHFDQDGLVSIFTLCQPEIAMAHREVLIDVASAGDFGKYNERRAAHASVVIAHWSDLGLGYEEALPRLMDLVTDPTPYRHIWEREDANLTASEAAIVRGSIVITEMPEIDLAIVEISDDEPLTGGHRFAHETFCGLHPMALHNATDRFRILVIAGNHYTYTDRYETWVQFQSRPTLARRNMAALAQRLNQLESGEWTAGSPDELVPTMTHTRESQLQRQQVVDELVAYLQS